MSLHNITLPPPVSSSLRAFIAANVKTCWRKFSTLFPRSQPAQNCKPYCFWNLENLKTKLTVQVFNLKNIFKTQQNQLKAFFINNRSKNVLKLFRFLQKKDFWKFHIHRKLVRIFFSVSLTDSISSRSSLLYILIHFLPHIRALFLSIKWLMKKTISIAAIKFIKNSEKQLRNRTIFQRSSTL